MSEPLSRNSGRFSGLVPVSIVLSVLQFTCAPGIELAEEAPLGLDREQLWKNCVVRIGISARQSRSARKS